MMCASRRPLLQALVAIPIHVHAPASPTDPASCGGKELWAEETVNENACENAFENAGNEGWF